MCITLSNTTIMIELVHLIQNLLICGSISVLLMLNQRDVYKLFAPLRIGLHIAALCYHMQA